MNQILDPVLRKDKFEIWRKKTNDIISLVNNISSNVKTTISNEPPVLAYNGDLWWDSTSGKLKIYYDDGDSKQWLDAFNISSDNNSTDISETPPTSPNIGDFWWDSTVGKLKIYYFDGDSCQWIDAFTSSQNSSKAEVVISDDPPLSPFIGQLWWDSTSGKLKIYYNDGDSVQWIDAFIYHNNSAVNVSESLPESAVSGELWWTPSTEKLKIYHSDEWSDAFTDQNTSTVTIGEDYPENADDGELWWNPCDSKLKVYYDDGDSKQWVEVSSSGSNSSTTISETPPEYPSIGDLWWDSTSGKLKINYDDGDSVQWIDAFISPQDSSKAEVVISDDPPLSPFVGQLWWDSTAGKLKINYNDGDSVQWIDAFIYHNKSLIDSYESLPSTAIEGQLVWNSSSNSLNLFQDDWVQVSNLPEDEKFTTVVDSSGDSSNLIDYDTEGTHSFYHSSPQDSWDINLLNLNMNTNSKRVIELVISQGDNGYLPSNIKVDGLDVTVSWNKSLTLDSDGLPIPSSNSLDKILYNIYCISQEQNEYIVLAEIEKF